MPEPKSPKPSSAKPARKSDLPLDARLSNTLVREIIDNHYPPGSWLREQEISARHGVSRASVREALRNVAYAGFVDIQPWRGAQVAQISKGDLLDIFSLLEQTYARCAAWAAERFPESALVRLDEMMVQVEDAVAKRSPNYDLDTLSFGIGQLVGRNSGSRLAYRMLVQVGNLALWQQRILLPGSDHTAQQSLSAHRVLASAIKAREPEIAEAAARMIVMITRRSLAERDFGPAREAHNPPRPRRRESDKRAAEGG
jgi:DNA-binding GntR family transcriptional regulator